MENDEAAPILASGGITPYTGQSWQLVQTHLIMPSGEIQELWKPGRDTGAADPDNLLAALDGAIEQLSLTRQPAPEITASRRLRDLEEGGMLLQLSLRIPPQEASPHERNFVVDWIPLGAADLDALRPPQDALIYPIPDALAARVLVHFRPSLDKGEDPDADAMAIMTAASLEGMVLSANDEQRIVGLSGSMTMQNPQPIVDPGSSHWLGINEASVSVIGYLTIDAKTEDVVDLRLVTEQASFVPPQGQPVHFRAAAQVYARE